MKNLEMSNDYINSDRNMLLTYLPGSFYVLINGQMDIICSLSKSKTTLPFLTLFNISVRHLATLTSMKSLSLFYYVSTISNQQSIGETDFLVTFFKWSIINLISFNQLAVTFPNKPLTPDVR